MKSFLLALLAALAAPVSLAAAEAAATPPNIIYILADDLGYGDLGCYGQQKIRTPNLDRLAREGMRFTQHYAGSAVCAPSRSVLLTGQHTGRTPIRGNKEYRPEGQYPLPGEAVTVAEVLRGAGFRTAAFGKWGLGFIHTEGDPLLQGFEHFFGYNCQRMAHRYYPPYVWENDHQVFLKGNDTYSKTTYAPDVIHRRALDYLRQRRDGAPFFLFLPYVAPHAELEAPDDEILASYRGRWPEKPFAGVVPGASRTSGFAYGDEDWSPAGYAPQAEPRAVYAAMVTRLDRQVGEIVRLVDELGLGANTVILFSSDNGPHVEGGGDPEFFDSNGPLRGTKRDLYEGGIRVPLIARWQGRIPAGVTNPVVSSFADMLPTFAELAGAGGGREVDGVSLVPELLGRGRVDAARPLYWEFAERSLQAVRAGKWKAIRTIAPDGTKQPLQLFNLEDDLGETKDLAAGEPAVVARLTAVMEREHHASPLFPLAFEAKR